MLMPKIFHATPARCLSNRRVSPPPPRHSVDSWLDSEKCLTETRIACKSSPVATNKAIRPGETGNLLTEKMNTIEFPRRANQWVEAPELRGLLKQTLGLNARKVSVSARHSTQYLTVTVRDASVDLKALERFCASLNTWSMDETDYVSGQSINVTTTREVDEAHAAPFLEEAAKIAAELECAGQWIPASTGAHVRFDGWRFEVSQPDVYRSYWGGERSNALAGKLHHLALAIARA